MFVKFIRILCNYLNLDKRKKSIFRDTLIDFEKVKQSSIFLDREIPFSLIEKKNNIFSKF